MSHESIDDHEDIDDFLNQVKGDLDDHNISGMFKVDVHDDKVRKSLDKDAKRYVTGTFKIRPPLITIDH